MVIVNLAKFISYARMRCGHREPSEIYIRTSQHTGGNVLGYAKRGQGLIRVLGLNLSPG